MRKIIISELMIASVGFGIEINEKFTTQQIANKIEKYLKRDMSIVCKVEVIE